MYKTFSPDLDPFGILHSIEWKGRIDVQGQIVGSIFKDLAP